MRKLLMASTSLLLLLSAGTSRVMAQTNSTNQTSADAAADTLQTVTVTADKRKVNLQKAAVDATVLKGETLKAQGLSRIDDMMRGVIGVETQETQVGPTFFMRGVGDTGSTSSPVAVYVDGVYQDRSEATRGGTLDMAQIEVARGPQGTSVGANSMAGSVSLESNQPVFTREGSVSVTRGNLNRLTVEAMLNQPITGDQAIRIAASTDTQDGIYTSGLENTDNKEGRVKYRFQPNADLNIVATLDDQLVYGNNGSGNNSTVTNAFGVVTTNSDEWKERGNPWNDGEPYGYYDTFHHTQIVDAHVNVDYNLGWATATVTPNWEQTNYHSLEAARCFGSGPSASCSSNYQNNWETTESFEGKLASPTTQRFQWIGGVYYYHSSQTGPAGQNTLSGGNYYSAPPGPPNPNAVIFTPCGQQVPGGSTAPDPDTALSATCMTTEQTKVATVSQEAIYANTTYSILPTLRLLTGLRFNNENIANQTSGELYQTTASPDGPGIGGFNGWTYQPLDKRHVNRPDYKISVEYDVTPSSMAYYTFSTGTSLGGVPGAGPPVGGATPTVFGNVSYVPPSAAQNWPEPQEEYSNAIGYKSRFFDNTLQFNAELFYQWYNHYNVQLQGIAETAGTICNAAGPPPPPGQSTPGCFSGSASTQNLQQKGGDISLTYLPTANDTITVNAGYLYAAWGAQTDTSSATSYALVNAYLKSYAGATLQNSPKWQANVTYAHTISLGDMGTLTPSVNMQAKTHYYSQFMGGSVINPSSDFQPGYVEWNLYANYTTLDGKYSLYAYVNNLTNFAQVTNETSGFGASTIDLAPPREYGIAASAKF